MAVVSLVLASLALARGDQAQAPSSHWATVYTGDTTHYSQPVRDQVYPLPEGVSRTDWFNSYPYHKFEAKQGEEAAAEAGLIENVASAVEDVRQRLSDLGDGVVNSALGLVGAGKKEDTFKREKVLLNDSFSGEDFFNLQHDIIKLDFKLFISLSWFILPAMYHCNGPFITYTISINNSFKH